MRHSARGQTSDGATCVAFSGLRGWQATVLVSHNKGRPVIAGLTLLPSGASVAPDQREDPLDLLAAYTAGGDDPLLESVFVGLPPTGGLTAHGLRQLPLGAVFAVAQEYALDQVMYPEQTGFDASSWPADLLPPARPRRPSLTADFLAHVAADYVKHAPSGKPNKRLAAIYGQDPSRVADWVLRARRSGLLTKATRGKPGGSLTKKAQRVLDAMTEGEQ